MADRFDKFTENARRVLTLAQEEGQRFHHNYIGTEHLLLGMLRIEDCVAMRALSYLGVDALKVRSAVEFIIGRDLRSVLGEIGLTPRAKKVIELSVAEARRLGHHYIGTEHLLLGLVREDEGIAAGVLESLGVSLDRAREAVARVLEQANLEPGVFHHYGPLPSRFRSQAPAEFMAGFAIGMALTPEAREAVRQAAAEAQRLGGPALEPGHLFLALTQPGSSLADALAAAGVDVERARAALLPSPDLRAAREGLAALRREKDNAIAAQEYERAARLRDQELKLVQKIEELENAERGDG